MNAIHRALGFGSHATPSQLGLHKCLAHQTALRWASVRECPLTRLPSAREHTAVAEEHQATVYENRGTDRHDPYVIGEGKFLAGCVCGWYSGQVESSEEAFAACP